MLGLWGRVHATSRLGALDVSVHAKSQNAIWEAVMQIGRSRSIIRGVSDGKGVFRY